MSNLIEQQQPQTEGVINDPSIIATADQSLDAGAALQKLIDELNEGDILVMADEIENCISRAKEQREQEISQLQETNNELQTEIEHKREEIRALRRTDDIRIELIETNSKIANHEFSSINKDKDLLRAISDRDTELFNLKLNITQENGVINETLDKLTQRSRKLRDELNEINEKLENPQPKHNIDPEKLKSYDLALLKLNFYRNLGIRIEPYNKSDSTLGEAANTGTSSQDDTDGFFDDPQDVVIVTNSKGELKTLPVGVSTPEEYITKFIWENIG
ncbi:Spc24 subunit of Ndc80 family protein [Candida parapsilosis]|uniref:Kinetochore protein Spc24 n=2 Tax=Candida parapsilosis TaxID=5480 RepID=G8BDP1_CANPC|nr:uncharacterized protein CPAR2_210330 [Candida parapsilosis]KAF6054463.1 Spc24 subunit of Ndc80 family protein [Candida parapsilosis]KAF6056513.1 Spc24 subunit of Ndc80 family protein [Candida parapsilosis]KAF6059448.1 Spc24 subunit of Ndc80 family protein [Candida parapsilosis]KAF6068201.1 Spc24 subunit of Ndc80 family protein [Candida parapsilosis]KAI5905128.1 hypothetical protein K4G60_g4386 [Candida parapsilosis]